MGKQHNPGDKPNRRGPASGGERRPYGGGNGGNSGSGSAERRPYGGGERGAGGPRSYGSGGSGSSYGGSRPTGRGGEGYSSNRPAFGAGGGSKFGGRPAEGGKFGSRPGASGPGKFGGDRPASGGSGERRSFGGGGTDRPASGGYGKPGFSKPGYGKPSFGEKRPYGDRPARDSERGGERPSYGPKRSFDGPPRSFDGPKRSFGGDRDERPRRYEGGGNDRPERRDRPESNDRSDQSDRPDRPAYPAKPIWQGQPVRYEGRPTVPRGGAGERNRKFIKLNPDGTPVDPAMSSATRPPYQPRTERPDGEAGEPRDERPRRETPTERPSYSPGERRSYGNRDPYERRHDSGGRDSRDGGPAERRAPAGDRPRDDRPREGGERRPYGGDRPERGPATGGERDERPRRYEGGGNDRPERRDRPERAAGSFDKPRTFDKPRSYGERPVSSGGSTTFRERREELRKAESGPRKGTGYGRADAARPGDVPGQAPDYKNLKHYEADKTRGNKSRRDDEDFGTEELRLNRYIANAGICSRREADALIAAGEIRVNGEVITEMGYKVQPTDTVQYGKTNLNREKLVYVLLNKPKDFITTTDDPEGRKTVMDLVKTASKERIFPVGRLDRNTTGLLLFTNDGEVAQKLSHPSHRNKKIYQVELDKPLTPEHLADITAGVELEDGKAEVDDVAVVAGNPHFVGIEIHIGRNRIVRRIFEHLGYDVVALDRVQYAGLTKKELSRGKWRFLSEQEVIRLKYFMG